MSSCSCFGDGGGACVSTCVSTCVCCVCCVCGGGICVCECVFLLVAWVARGLSLWATEL